MLLRVIAFLLAFTFFYSVTGSSITKLIQKKGIKKCAVSFSDAEEEDSCDGEKSQLIKKNEICPITHGRVVFLTKHTKASHYYFLSQYKALHIFKSFRPPEARYS